MRKHLYEKIGRKGFSETEMRESMQRLRQALDRMEASLTDAPWLVGQQFTLADISITPTIVRLEILGHAELWADLPRVTDWCARMRARPSFAATYYEGSRPPVQSAGAC